LDERLSFTSENTSREIENFSTFNELQKV